MTFDPCAELGLSKQQVKNLRKLAAYLKTLPVDYPDFAMDEYVRGVDPGEQARVAECGTAACAAGHGPAAGVKPMPGENWTDYSFRAFADPLESWSWCFESTWSGVDNTAHGAAARIEFMLREGVPDNMNMQMYGHAPLSYRTEQPAS